VETAAEITNPRAAKHPGGQWDLGDPGSVLIRDLSIHIKPMPRDDADVWGSLDAGDHMEPAGERFAVHQESSGGQQWQHVNHASRDESVPARFRGFRAIRGGREVAGLRATPIASIGGGDTRISVALPYFWEVFPKAIEADAHQCVVSMFPRASGDVHELQGGERSTFTFAVCFGRDTVTAEPLGWVRSPLRVAAASLAYRQAGAWAPMGAGSGPSAEGYEALINTAIHGPESFKERRETIDGVMQGASLMMLSLNYDKAYVADENTDPLSLQYMNRKEVRDAAIAKLQEAITLANANEFTTPVTWTNGKSYTNLQIAQIANTMAAMTLAYYPRDNSEVGSVDWAQVASFASEGMSAGSPVDFWFVADNSAWSHEVLAWFGEIDSGRLHTRVSHLLDPATQKDPWPATQGNPQPNSLDKRLGDGSFGDADTQKSFKTTPKTALAGTDFAWTANGQAMRPDRGQYHQSNLAYIRYDESGVQDPDQQYGNKGRMPAINATLNDLIWAEALLRQGAGNAAQAATLIDKTRVVRGGLSSSAAAIGNIGADADGPCMSNGKLAKDGTACSLWSMLLYEQEIEALALGPAPFYQQRRLPLIIGGGFAGDNSPKRVIAGLLPGTPHEMPVPAKELGVKGEALYTWGGSKPNSAAP